MKTIPRPRISETPTAARLRASHQCPVELARQIGQVARRVGTLPSDLAELRRIALVEARQTFQVTVLAGKVGLSAARVSQLTAETVA